MCTNKKWIYTAEGKRIMVKCGKCPACLQEKAIARTNRIRANFPDSSPSLCLFVTLTYNDKSVPYIRVSDLKKIQSQPPVEHVQREFSCVKMYEDYVTTSVYRDCMVRRNRKDSSYNFKRDAQYETVKLCSIPLRPEHLRDELPKLCINYKKKIYDTDRVGVIYYKDVQDFIKRLRTNLTRKYKVNDNISFYSCAEYGAASARPHFHLLMFASPRLQHTLYRAIPEAWSFDDNNLTARNISVAVDAASYVSTYVNCDAIVPPLLKDSWKTKQHHSYSKGFGMALKCYSLASVFEAYRRGDLRTDVSRLRNGALVVDRVLLPKYVINRYFPKFKGFSRLTPNEVQRILQRPADIELFKEGLNLSDDECNGIYTLLMHKRQAAVAAGINIYDYADCYSNIWNLRFAQVMRQFYENQSNPIKTFYAYDNIIDVCSGDLNSPNIFEGCLCRLPSSFEYETDPNKFPDNVAATNNLLHWYDTYNKSRKVHAVAYRELKSEFNI